jgi:hypothetical protein
MLMLVNAGAWMRADEDDGVGIVLPLIWRLCGTSERSRLNKDDIASSPDSSLKRVGCSQRDDVELVIMIGKLRGVM